MTLSNLAVKLDFQYPAMGDLAINLISPDGLTTVPLALAGKLSERQPRHQPLRAAARHHVRPERAPEHRQRASPYIGSFSPAAPFGMGLNQFFNKPIQTGDWKIQIINTNTTNTGLARKAELVFMPG